MDPENPHDKKSWTTGENYRPREISIQHNYSEQDRAKGQDDLLFVRVGPGVGEWTTLSKEQAREIRDHLTTLLDEDTQVEASETTPVADPAVVAMENLAHQMSLFYTDDLADALNRHAAALETFNK